MPVCPQDGIEISSIPMDQINAGCRWPGRVAKMIGIRYDWLLQIRNVSDEKKTHYEEYDDCHIHRSLRKW